MAKSANLANQAAELHGRLLFARAVEKYREAITYQDHPCIRYFLSRALESMGKPLDAYEHLSIALPGLEPEFQTKAREFERALIHQLAAIEVRSEQPGVQVSLDGEPWFIGPGHERRLVTPGQHVITATKASHSDLTMPISLSPSERGAADLRLIRVDKPKRRWEPWKPWAVVTAGVAAGLVGGWMRIRASRGFEAFDERWERVCADQSEPCREKDHPELMDTLRQAEWKQYIATGSFVLSATLLVAGVTLIELNRIQNHHSSSVEDRMNIEIGPILSADQAGFAIGGSF